MVERFIDVTGGRLYCDTVGEGEPLVLVHAGIADSRMWDPQVGPLSAQHQVIRYDIRGYGQSSDPTCEVAHHEDLLAVLDDLGVDRARLLGVSLGGIIVIDFALAHPERVRSLVLVATCPSGYDGWGGEIRQGWEEENAAMETGDFERATDVALRMWVSGPARSPDDVDPSVITRFREMAELNVPRQGEGGEIWVEPPAVGRLDEIDVPTLVIVGDKDQPDMIQSSRMLAREIRGARMKEMAGVAHLPNLEKPEEFNRLVVEFLRTV
jgi:pimeloyl-ACP methyl ester carboxylesterase